MIYQDQRAFRVQGDHVLCDAVAILTQVRAGFTVQIGTGTAHYLHSYLVRDKDAHTTTFGKLNAPHYRARTQKLPQHVHQTRQPCTKENMQSHLASLVAR